MMILSVPQCQITDTSVGPYHIHMSVIRASIGQHTHFAQRSQSSSTNENISKAESASLVPLAKLSTPRLMKRTSASSSEDIFPTWSTKLSSANDTAIDAVNIGSTALARSSTSDSEEDEELDSSATGVCRNSCEKPMTLCRCLLCRRLRCLRKLAEVFAAREMSCVTSPANETKQSPKCKLISRMDMIARRRAAVWGMAY